MASSSKWFRRSASQVDNVGSNPAGVTICYDLFYKRNKRCIHREKGRDTEMYPIKLSQTKRLILRCVPYLANISKNSTPGVKEGDISLGAH